MSVTPKLKIVNLDPGRAAGDPPDSGFPEPLV
jgi:hypothetical protein